ncbi:MarR family transcriptional regulator [Arthrobacter sp. JCM 19049]|uniref:MarR family transcriptional regulator n=1 Tax=Arthrobacter sp. JCM 19049 TaxID=1460643 RepID=UPI000B1332A4|nr:MarR family transcriptional regulator [Arthrobacter sp. JCM 19049]
MAQMGRLRAVERKISRASQQYMKLNETDMRAIRMLIAARHREEVVTPGQLAKHLGISTASVTKMLDRLEAGGTLPARPIPPTAAPRPWRSPRKPMWPPASRWAATTPPVLKPPGT